jgi:hypothetical protein
MKATFLVCCIFALVLVGLSCAPEGTLEISLIEIDNGVMIENISSVACLVFVSSPEGEQQFELAVGENVTVTDISQPIDVSAVSLQDKMATTAGVSFLTLWGAVVAGMGALAAIITIGWLLYKLGNRPRFLVGAIPFEVDNRYWMRVDPIDEATFNKDYFALKYRSARPISRNIWESLRRCRVKFDTSKYHRDKLEILKKDKHKLRCRVIELSSEKYIVALPLLVKNIGRVNAEKLHLSVYFDEQNINILDVYTDIGFTVDAFYSQNPEKVTNEKLKELVPLQPIRAIYNDRLDCPGDLVLFSGDLGTGTHVAFQLNLSIPHDINAFHMLIDIDHTQSLRTDEYMQRVEISRL